MVGKTPQKCTKIIERTKRCALQNHFEVMVQIFVTRHSSALQWPHQFIQQEKCLSTLYSSDDMTLCPWPRINQNWYFQRCISILSIARKTTFFECAPSCGAYIEWALSLARARSHSQINKLRYCISSVIHPNKLILACPKLSRSL